MPDDRRYTDAELHAIFERAAKRQEAAARAEAASHGGLTLAELQDIGAASGIDPAHVAAAAAELSAPKRGEPTRWPREVVAERWLPGPVSDDAWEAIVETLRRELNKPGVAGQVGRTREWTTIASGGRQPDAPVSVTLRPEGERTRLAVRQSWEEYSRVPLAMGAAFSFTALLLGGIFAFIEPSALFMPVAFAALGLLLFAAGPPAMRAFARKKEAEFERLLDRLELVARDATPQVEAPAEPVPERRIHLDDLPVEKDGANATERRRTRS